ncbi:phage holin family protein [Algoriphagus sp.]|jgi:cobalamin biosynthesis protein CobD/CbiB|uniref:phage holin family protein n=1 Tax=Algoriphagus sp. TaxID=1872435 RepID=UPI002721E715|nr:phage holin family protein [Algoriphagus sp.]MDO8965664.1 phage holin family protein [Algoriphagus sp.]MDP3200499.1 phage holin family protein [Algoriphagus sp.]
MLKISHIIETVKGIVETRVGLVKQEIQKQFVEILSRIILLILMGSLLLLVFLFLSLSLAFFLSQVTKSPYLGFLIVALIYFMVVILLFQTKDSLQIQKRTEGLLNNFIFKMKRNKNENDDEQLP